MSWTQRPQEAGHSHTSQEDTQHRVSSSSNSRGGQGAADTLPETGRAPRMAKQNCTPARPLWPCLAGKRRLKEDGRAPPRFPTRSSSLEGCGPARRSPSGHIQTLASGPSSTATDLCPFKSHHHEVLAPPQEAGAPGRAAARLALPARRLQRGQPSTEARRKQIQPRERSGRVRAVFHRKRGGEPTASSTRRRACTGGQRQSYKRAGYLTRSSGLVSWGLVGTAIELRSSSWRDRRRFLEGKERSLGCWGTRSGHPTHLPQAEGLPGFWHPREGVTGGPQLPSVACKASLGTDEPQAPCPGPVLPLPHQASGSQLHKVASATIPTRRPYQRLLISVLSSKSPPCPALG